MPLPDTMYCAQQINIPPQLPDILKNFTKAAIRTQPKDLLPWSTAYFRALSKGECLPVKDRLEMKVATQKTNNELTPGLLKILHKQVNGLRCAKKLGLKYGPSKYVNANADANVVLQLSQIAHPQRTYSYVQMELSVQQTCSKEELQQKWTDLCLPMEQLGALLSLGGFGSDVDWMEFFALGCSALGGTLIGSLKFACEILTEDEEGGAARIPYDIFVRLYTYLAHVDGDIRQDHIKNFLSSLQAQVELQDGMIKPLDFIHWDDIDSTPPSSSDSARAMSKAK